MTFRACRLRVSIALVLRTTLACLLHAVGAVAAAGEVQLGDTRARVVQALGSPAAEWSTALCPDSTLALYPSRTAILKLVFDKRNRLHAVGLTAILHSKGKRWPALGWPLVAGGIASLSTYASHGGMAPWFYNFSPREITYFERSIAPGVQGERFYTGSVSVGTSTDFATDNDFPFDEADVATDALARGKPLSKASLRDMNDWRRRNKPNSYVRVAFEAPGTEERCGGFFLGRLIPSDMAGERFAR